MRCKFTQPVTRGKPIVCNLSTESSEVQPLQPLKKGDGCINDSDTVTAASSTQHPLLVHGQTELYRTEIGELYPDDHTPQRHRQDSHPIAEELTECYLRAHSARPPPCQCDEGASLLHKVV